MVSTKTGLFRLPIEFESLQNREILMKNKILLIFGLCAAAMLALPSSAPAASKKKSLATESASPAASASGSAAKSGTRPFVFHGMATSVDQKAQTFTIAGKEKSRVFKVTTNTKVTKAGNPATMADITDNTEISGSYWQHDDGSLEAKTIKLGPVKDKKGKKNDKASGAESPAASPKP